MGDDSSSIFKPRRASGMRLVPKHPASRSRASEAQAGDGCRKADASRASPSPNSRSLGRAGAHPRRQHWDCGHVASLRPAKPNNPAMRAGSWHQRLASPSQRGDVTTRAAHPLPVAPKNSLLTVIPPLPGPRGHRTGLCPPAAGTGWGAHFGAEKPQPTGHGQKEGREEKKRTGGFSLPSHSLPYLLFEKHNLSVYYQEIQTL